MRHMWLTYIFWLFASLFLLPSDCSPFPGLFGSGKSGDKLSVVYRGDMRPPDVIKSEGGFKVRAAPGSDAAFSPRKHVEGFEPTNTMFVSTSEKIRVAGDFAVQRGLGFVYDIQITPNAIDINRSYKGSGAKNKKWGWEKEHAFVGGIGWNQVRGWRPVETHRDEDFGIEFPSAGEFVKNPDYDTKFDKFRGAGAQPQLFADKPNISMQEEINKVMSSNEAKEAKVVGGDHFAPSFCAVSKKRDAGCVPKFGASDEGVYRSKWGAANQGPPGGPPGVIDEDAVRTPEEKEEAEKKPKPKDAGQEEGPAETEKLKPEDVVEKPPSKAGKDVPSKPDPASPPDGNTNGSPNDAIGEKSPKERLKSSKTGPKIGKTLALTGLLKLTTGVVNTVAKEVRSGNETNELKEVGRIMESILRENTVNYDEAASSLQGCSLMQRAQPDSQQDAEVSPLDEISRGFMHSMRCHLAGLEYLARNAPLSGETMANVDKRAGENEAWLQANPNPSFAESLAHSSEMRNKIVGDTVIDLLRGFIPGFTEVEENADKAIATYKNGAEQGKTPELAKLMFDMWSGVLNDLKNHYIPLAALAGGENPGAKALEALGKSLENYS